MTMKKTIILFLFLIFIAPTLVFAQSPDQVNQIVEEGAEPITFENAAENLQHEAEKQFTAVKSLIDTVIEYVVTYFFQALGGIIILILGWIAAGYLTNFVTGFLKSKNVDVTVTGFIGGTVRILVMAFAIMVAMGKFGIEIAPLIAGISVIGFGTSFALQGPLSNYAAGISLIFTKPFKVGDIVEVAGEMGQIKDIKLPRTEMINADGSLVIIPNNKIIGEIIQNFSHLKRLDLTIGVSYSSNMDKVLKIINDVVAGEKLVNEKQPVIGISEFADSSVNIMIRLFTPQAEYWNMKFKLNKAIFEALGKNNIEIPFPQRDIHIKEKPKQ